MNKIDNDAQRGRQTTKQPTCMYCYERAVKHISMALLFSVFSACVFQLATRAINQRLYVWRSADWRAMITRRDESRDHATHVVLFTVGRMS